MRHSPSEFDVSMLEFLKGYNVPYAIVLTTCDKLNKSEFEKQLVSIKNFLGELALNVPVIPFSALKSTGVAEIKELIG